MHGNPILKSGVSEHLVREIVKADDRVASFLKELNKIDVNRKNWDKRFDDDEKLLDEQFRRDIAALTTSNAKSHDQLFNLQKQLAKIGSEKASLEMRYQQIETKKQQQLSFVSQAENKINRLQSQQLSLQHQIANRNIIVHIIKYFWGDAEKEQIQQLEQQIQSVTSEKNRLQQIVNKLQQDIQTCQAEQQNIRNQQKGLQNQENFVQLEIGKLTKQGEELRKKHNESIRITRDNKQKKQSELMQARLEIIAEFQKNWGTSLLPLDEIVKTVRRTQPFLNSLQKENLNTTDNLPETLAFGRLRVTLSQNWELENWSGFVPRLLDFPIRKTLFFEYDKESDNQILYQLLLRLLFVLPVGILEITAIDPLHLGRSLAPFLPLANVEEIVPQKRILTHSDEIESTLHQMFDYIDKLMQKRFLGDISNWIKYNDMNPDCKLSYKLLLLFGFPEQFSDKSILYLKRLIEFGPRCGVIPIISIDRNQIDPKSAAGEIPQLLEKTSQKIYNLYSNCPLLKYLQVTEEDELLPSCDNLTQYWDWIKSAYSQYKKFNKTIIDMWSNSQLGKENSSDGISAPIGWTTEGKEILLQLGGINTEHHVLLAGRSGSGKSNLLHILIHNFIQRYLSDELAVYLLDYKQGTEFNVYANPTIPQIKLIATESDTEYGITVLSYLAEEIKKRADLFKQLNIGNFKEFRKKSEEKMPRVLLIIDEFQMLFQDNEIITRQADKYFNILLRQGRSYGIHVLLATQTLKGLQSTTSIGQLVSQIGCRIALACNREDSALILDGSNWEAAELKSPPEAIINNQNGQKSGNYKFNIPFANREICTEHLHKIAIYAQEKGFFVDTKIFNGARLPEIPTQKWFNDFIKVPSQIVLGEELNFDAKPFVCQWECKMGSNLCIAGDDDSIRYGILRSILYSIQQNNIFNKIVYYNSNHIGTTYNLSDFENISIQNHTWDCNITELTNELQNKRTLLIIDSFDSARLFHPKPQSFGVKKSENISPADLLKILLDEGPQLGSFVLAFIDNWKRFNPIGKDYLNCFEMRIGFHLNEEDASSLITGSSVGKFKGLDNPNKAIFVNRQKNIQTLFRPFIASQE
ncbi:MAG: hypothetical protein LBC20_09625 [Planctomycetaceae bacterium]|jgi:hypothetical protein|nr:hypothetical protein [Planctomycetaceae bacterium]